MLKLCFDGIGPFHSQVTDPVNAVRISGNFIRDPESQSVIAQFREHLWQVGGAHYTGFELRDPLVIHFEDFERIPSERFGPFERIKSVDGSMYADDKPFAKLNPETLLWHCFGPDTHWPVMVLTARAKG